MRGIIIFFATGRFTRMAADAVIGIKIKAMLFIAIWIFSNRFIAIDIE